VATRYKILLEGKADIAMNSFQLTGLAAPDANGEAIRATAVITEAALETVINDAINWPIFFGG
jgi:hypothetical protein